MLETANQRTLYEQDFVAWCDDTVTKLKAGHFPEIDIHSLIEEIESLAGRDRRELKSRLRVLLAHLLKRIYVNSPENYRGWEITIREQRSSILDLLEQSPSLGTYLSETFPRCWNDALAEVNEDYPQAESPENWALSNETDTLLKEKFW